VGPKLEMVNSRASWGFLSVPEPSSILSGVPFGSRAFLVWLLRGVFTWRLGLPTWGVDVDGLAYPLHRPTVHSRELRGRAYLPDAVLCCHCGRRWRSSGEGRLPGLRYLMESSSSSIHELLNITHGKSFLLGGAYHWQSHDGIYACSPSLAMSGDDWMDSILECVLSGACGFLLVCPVVPGA
jgi:hypothetical protein